MIPIHIFRTWRMKTKTWRMKTRYNSHSTNSFCVFTFVNTLQKVCHFFTLEVFKFNEQEEIYELHLVLPIDEFIEQECIPVGCVPSTAVAARGWLPRRGVSDQGVSTRGGCLPSGVSAEGMSAQGVYPSSEHVLGKLGVCIPACTGQVGVSACWDTHPPVDRILDTRLWKHYLSATMLRTVMKRNYC